MRLYFGLLTTAIFLACWRCARNCDENHYSGAIWATLCQRSARGADPGAYMFGKLFGKHKLAPKLSGKTRKWFIGGLLRLPKRDPLGYARGRI